MDFHSRLLKPQMRCASVRQRWEVGALCTCALETVALTWPESHACVFHRHLGPLTGACSCDWMHGGRPDLRACSCKFWGKYLKGIASILPALGQPVVARSPEATQTLACGPQPIPSPVNLTLSPGLPHLRYRTSSGCHPPQTLQ